ncbi:MAG: hypothetical protein R6V59_03360 [Dehalococcoidia bacterium]
MGVTLVNWGLAIAFLGAIILAAAAFDFDPVKAFREKNGDLEFSSQLFKKLGRRLRWGILSGVCILGIGTLLQLLGNTLS